MNYSIFFVFRIFSLFHEKIFIALLPHEKLYFAIITVTDIESSRRYVRGKL